MKNTLTSLLLAGTVALSGASVGCKRKMWRGSGVRSVSPQTTEAYNSKYGVPAGPLALENTNLTINAPHITRKDITYLVETNQYARPNELSWVLRPANSIDLHPYSTAAESKTFRADGLYLIPTLRTNANGEPLNGVYVSNSSSEIDFVKKQKVKDYGYGAQINVSLSDPLVTVPILGTNYYMPDLLDSDGNVSVRIVPAVDDRTFMRDGQRFLPGHVYGLNLVSQDDYLLRSIKMNGLKTNAVEQPKTNNYGVVRETN